MQPQITTLTGSIKPGQMKDKREGTAKEDEKMHC